MSSSNIIIAHPVTEDKLESLKAFLKALKIKFEVTEQDKSYNSEFVAKIKRSEADFKNGRFTTVKVKDLDKYIDNL